MIRFRIALFPFFSSLFFSTILGISQASAALIYDEATGGDLTYSSVGGAAR